HGLLSEHGEDVILQGPQPIDAIRCVAKRWCDFLMNRPRGFLKSRNVALFHPPLFQDVLALSRARAESRSFLARLGQRCSGQAAKSDVSSLPAHQSPENPGTASGRLHVEVEPVAVSVHAR